MGKNKIIFVIVVIVLVLGVAGLFFFLSKGGGSGSSSKIKGNLTIRTYGLDQDKMNNLVNSFNASNKDFRFTVSVTNFTNYRDYKKSLFYAFYYGKAPDVFLANNYENYIFEDKILGINPTYLNPNDFRNTYKIVFSNDLIKETIDSDNNTVEYVTGIPVGYETLGLYYNKKYVSNLEDNLIWQELLDAIGDVRNKNPDIIPLGIHNSKNSNISSDVLSQLFVFNRKQAKNATSSEKSFFNIDSNTVTSGYNNFNSIVSVGDEFGAGRSNLDLFNNNEEAILVGYQSLLSSIDTKLFDKNNLGVVPFPHIYDRQGDSLIRYTYFVMNSEIGNNFDTAMYFFSYLYTEEGANDFLKEFNYFLPAQTNLEKQYLSKSMNSNFSINYSNFINTAILNNLTSFNKISGDDYDDTINEILDRGYDDKDQANETLIFKDMIACEYNKYKNFNLEDLIKPCQ